MGWLCRDERGRLCHLFAVRQLCEPCAVGSTQATTEGVQRQDGSGVAGGGARLEGTEPRGGLEGS
eukprot:1196190-Prorocentrum_minimum.AAC.7